MYVARRNGLFQVTVLVALVLNAVASRLLNAGKEVSRQPVQFEAPTRLAYDYSMHGQDWAQGQCSSRERGSPLNFDDLGTLPSGPPLYYNYINASERFFMYNDGNQLQAFFTNMGYGGITWANGWYNLDRIEFHSYSEHTFMQMHYPLEMHLVHTRDDSAPDGPPLMIVAVMFESPKYGLMQKVHMDAKFNAPPPPPAGPAGAPGPAAAPAAPAPALVALKKKILSNRSKNAALLAARKAKRSHISYRKLKVREDPEPAGEDDAGDDDEAEESDAPAPAPAVAPGPAAPEGPPPYEPPSEADEGWNKHLQAFLTTQLPSRLANVYQFLDNLHQLDLNPMLEHGEFFRYTGAMTYPPCNEEPVMFVRRNPHKASDAQVKLFHDLIFETNMGNGNYRSVMPLNNRPLTVMTAVRGEPPLKADVYNIKTDGTNPVTERELRAMRWSQRALTIANQATLHAKELDERMRRAAEAHLAAQSGLVGGAANEPLHIKYGPDQNNPENMAGMDAAIRNEANTAAEDHIVDMRLQVPEKVKQAAETHLDKAEQVVAQYQGTAASALF